jgi:MFS family permease
MKHRYRVLLLLFTLSMITFLDRVCLSVAGPRMQSELHLAPQTWGWVVGVFSLSYGIFQIPTGTLGDRIGARRVLSAIVLWWSAFTSFTGLASSVYPLLGVRFLFGMGEAGAYPNSSRAIAQWFPTTERARAHGMVWMASRLGGAVTPLLIIPLQSRYGWRVGFHFLGLLGTAWAVIWYLWFRDRPAESAGITSREIEEIGGSAVSAAHTSLPWSRVLRSSNFWAILLMYHAFGYGGFFFLSWLNTYLVKGRGFAEKDIVLLAGLPFFLGAIANCVGGYAGDAVVRRIGNKWGRRIVGSLGMAFSAVFTLAAALAADRYAAIVFLALGAASSDFLLPTCWATCLDIGRKYTGAVTASMNMAGQISSFAASVLFGYAVAAWNSYDRPLIPMAAILFLGALLWLKIDASEELVPEAKLAAVPRGVPV